MDNNKNKSGNDRCLRHSSVLCILEEPWTTTRKTPMDGLAASSYKPPSGMRHAQSLENVSWGASPRKKYWGPLDKVRIVNTQWIFLAGQQALYCEIDRLRHTTKAETNESSLWSCMSRRFVLLFLALVIVVLLAYWDINAFWFRGNPDRSQYLSGFAK